jgi:hypothetical protein
MQRALKSARLSQNIGYGSGHIVEEMRTNP